MMKLEVQEPLQVKTSFRHSYLQDLELFSIEEGAVLDADDAGPGVDLEGAGRVLQDVEELPVGALKRGQQVVTTFFVRPNHHCF